MIHPSPIRIGKRAHELAKRESRRTGVPLRRLVSDIIEAALAPKKKSSTEETPDQQKAVA